jgi:tetratricopeptide (TPR) repeat protein
MPPRLFALAALLLAAPPAFAADAAAGRRVFIEAKELYIKGDFRGSLAALNRALAEDKSLAPAYELRARCWDALGDGGRARADAEKALSLAAPRRGAEESVAQGGAELLLGRPKKALESLNAAVAAGGDPESLAARARVWRRLGDRAKALADLDAALKARPKAPVWLYSRALTRYELGNDAGAVADLTAALRGNKQFAPAYGLVGSALARKGDLKRALKAYEKALSVDAAYGYAYLGRAAIRLKQGDEAGALKDFEEAVRCDAQDYAPYYNRGDAHWRAGRREPALADFRLALGSPKLTAEAAAAIGDRYMSIQLWREAVEAYGRAREEGAGISALLRMARAYEALKEPKKALAELDAAVKEDPGSAPALAARAGVASRLGLDDAALADYTRALRLEPTNPEILTARGSFYAKADKPNLALEDFDAAIAADPKHAEAYNGRGALYANALGDQEKALRDVLKAVELKPREPGYHFNMGVLRTRNRLFHKALESFELALELKGPAARVLERRADAKFLLGDHVGAVRDIESALEKDPRNPSLYDTLGWIRLRAKEPEQAVRDLSQALHLQGDLAPALVHRGLAYGTLRQLKNAAADFERALKLEPSSKEAWTYLCQARRLQKSPKEALKACDRAVAIDSQYGPAYLQRALAWHDLRQWPRVIEDIESAWQLGTRRAEGILARAIAHAANRQYSEAHRSYLLALRLDPYVKSPYIGFTPGHPEGQDFLTAIVDLDKKMQEDIRNPYVFILRADSLHNADQFDKAVLEYTKAMELDGSVADAYVGRGVALSGQDALEASQQDFIRALELDPDDSGTRVRLATVLTMRRNYRAALSELAKATRADPKNAEAHLRMGNVHYFLKDYAKALESYALASKADPLDANALNGQGLAFYALRRHEDALEYFSRALALNPLSDRFYRNRAAVWTNLQRYGNAAADFRAASMVNTDPTLVDEYRRLIEESETRSAKGKST